MVVVNLWAVVASAVVMMVLGALWYGPLFGKQWASLMNIALPEGMGAEEKRKMRKSYMLMALGSLIMSSVLAHALVFASAYLNLSGVTAGIQVGFAYWLGFIAPVTMSPVLWEQKPWKLWYINAGYYLVGLVAIGIILALWQ